MIMNSWDSALTICAGKAQDPWAGCSHSGDSRSECDIEHMLGLFSLPCPGKSIITFKSLYFLRSGAHGSPVFTPSPVAYCRKSRLMLSYL